MLVVDASALVEFLVSSEETSTQKSLLSDGHWVVPEHFMLEVTSALRGLWLRARITEAQLDR